LMAKYLIKYHREGYSMGLTLKERQSVTRQLAVRYQNSTKKEKGRILDEYLAITGYNRSYASYVLSHWGKKKTFVDGNKRVVVEITRHSSKKRKRPIIYDKNVQKALEHLWACADGICGKRLAPILPEFIRKLEQFGEIQLDPTTRQKLLRISASTIDRVLKPVKQTYTFKHRSHTKPGTLLKHQIPIRTFADWNDHIPGFVEVDLVGHDGGNLSGDFAYTLDITDVATGWIELFALKNKARKWVIEALKTLKTQLPFPLRGIDSDNGSEFINSHLQSFCQLNEITFTRTRPYRKNDNCFVEQKNYTVVRRTVGYHRYDTEYQLKLLNRLYQYLRLFVNFFQPSVKLVEKTRIGSRVKKKYDMAKTPFQRVLQHDAIDTNVKEQLKQQYEELNPAQLKRKIVELQSQLERSVEKQPKIINQNPYNNRGYLKLRKRNNTLA